MRNLSSEFKKLQDEGTARFLKYVDFTLKDGTELHLTNENLWSNGFKFEDAVSSESSFDIGSAITNQCQININNMYDEYADYMFEGAEVVCYIGLKLSPTGLEESKEEAWRDVDGNKILDMDGNEIILKWDDSVIEKVRICTMTVVDAPYQNSSIINLTCQDNMMRFDREYSGSKLQYPATRGEIIRDACDVCGVTLATMTFDNDDYMIKERPSDEGLTFRQVIAWVAQCGCQWLRCNEDGHLCVGWYDTESEESDMGTIINTNGLTVNMEDVVITGVKVTESAEASEENNKSYLCGSDGYVLEISGNKLISEGTGDEIASMIGKRCIGMKFRPFTANRLTDISLEAGDAVIVTDRKGNRYKSYITNMNIQPGNYQLTECNAQSAARNSSKRYELLTQVQVAARKYTQKKIKHYDSVVQQMTKLISQGFGMYLTEVEQENGGSIFYLHDKPKMEESSYVCYWTTNGIIASLDGGTTWAIDKNGNALFNVITARGVNASWINTGEFQVVDEKGNEVFYVNCDTGVVRIKAQQFSLTGESIEEIANKQIDNWVDSIYNADLNEIKKQLSNKIETWYQDTDPALNWDKITEVVWCDVDGYPILDVDGNKIITYYEETKAEHEGDLWKNSTTKEEYIYRSGHWELMPVPDSVFNEIAGKSTIYINTPETPYKVGDTWFTGTDILVCKTTRENGSYVASDWGKRDNYTDDSALKKFMAGEYAETIKEIKSQVDGKAETWRQDNDPSSEWTTEEIKTLHKGDLWYKTSEQKSYIYTGSTWQEMKTNPPDEVFDVIDGKAQIFSKTPTPPYYENDLYLTGTDILVCKTTRESGSYVASDWGKRDNYTDDSKIIDFIKNTYTPKIQEMQEQIDGKLESFFKDYEPTLENYPANTWTTEEERLKHNADTFYWSSKKATYIFCKIDGVWQWLEDKDPDIQKAMEAAAAAQDTADGKRRTFVTTPVPPYDVGDLWIQGDGGDLMCCIVAKENGNYQSSDWGKATKYTDNSALDKFNEELNQSEIFNRLTNNGTEQGIFLRDGKIYINFTYAEGGILKLGGKNNVNGTLEVYDENGTLIGKLGKDGFDLKGVLKAEGENSTTTLSNGMIDIRKSDDIFSRILADDYGLNMSTYGDEDKARQRFLVNNKNMLGLGYKGPGIFDEPLCYMPFGFYSPDKAYIKKLYFSSDESAYIYVSSSDKKTIVFQGGHLVKGNFVCTGTKNRIVETKSFSDRLLYCYEMPTPMFGDIGEGTIGADGKCYINIDPVFFETIASGCKYQVFLQKNGKGDLWVSERFETYFVVEGTEDLNFSWEIKARQRDYEYERIEQYLGEDEMQDIDYGEIGAKEYQNYVNTMQAEV